MDVRPNKYPILEPFRQTTPASGIKNKSTRRGITARRSFGLALTRSVIDRAISNIVSKGSWDPRPKKLPNGLRARRPGGQRCLQVTDAHGAPACTSSWTILVEVASGVVCAQSARRLLTKREARARSSIRQSIESRFSGGRGGATDAVSISAQAA